MNNRKEQPLSLTVNVIDLCHHFEGKDWVPAKVTAEVIALYFTTGKMRVRYKGPEQMRAIDVDIQPFLDKYVIEERNG